MKAKELAEILMKNPDFEVDALYTEIYDDKFGYGAINYQTFEVVGITDVGYSEKVVTLDLQDK